MLTQLILKNGDVVESHTQEAVWVKDSRSGFDYSTGEHRSGRLEGSNRRPDWTKKAQLVSVDDKDKTRRVERITCENCTGEGEDCETDDPCSVVGSCYTAKCEQKGGTGVAKGCNPFPVPSGGGTQCVTINDHKDLVAGVTCDKFEMCYCTGNNCNEFSMANRAVASGAIITIAGIISMT